MTRITSVPQHCRPCRELLLFQRSPTSLFKKNENELTLTVASKAKQKAKPGENDTHVLHLTELFWCQTASAFYQIHLENVGIGNGL